MRLSLVLRYRGRTKEALSEAQRACELNPGDVWAAANLARLCAEMGRTDLARSARERQELLLSRQFSPMTRRSYRRLKAALDRRGAVLFAVQYPMRPVTDLQVLLEGVTGVTFVSNEESFHEAVRREGYDAVFRDAFAGDFGHCTARGNRLLAENIAAAVLARIDAVERPAP